MGKIGFIAPYQKACDVAIRIAESYGVDMICEIAMLSEGVEIARDFFENKGISAVVARAPTSKLLIKEFGPNISEISVTNYSFLRALEEAKQISKRIAFVYGPETDAVLDIPFAEKILDIELLCIEYTGEPDSADHCLRQLYEQNISNMVTTFSAPKFKQKSLSYGVHSILVPIEEEALDQAIKTAIMISNSRERARKLSLYLNNDPEGLILFDSNETIYIFNHAMEQITGVFCNKAIGLSLKDAVSLHPVFEHISNGRKIFTLDNNIQYLATSIQYNTPDEPSGRAIKLIEIENTYTRDRTVRQGMDKGSFRAKNYLTNILGESECMQYVKLVAERYARTASNILITGESGTGKELFAQGIHNVSAYRGGPFVAINCASLPDNLFESELYGYEEGAFTGARRGGKIGLFELSHGGTLFLDEIGELPLSVQVRLLRSIQERQIIRVGGGKAIHISNRIICATNRDLREAVEQGDFRADLFYRINVLRLNIPPLRERKGDIEKLAKLLSRRFRNARNELCYIPDHLLERLALFDWPGNVRQLEAFIESLIVTTDSRCIDEVHFNQMLWIQMLDKPGEMNQMTGQLTDFLTIKAGTLEDMTLQLMRQVYEQENQNTARCAKRLGVSRSTLWRKLQSN